MTFAILLLQTAQLACSATIRVEMQGISYCVHYLASYSAIAAELSYAESSQRSSLALYSAPLQNVSVNLSVPAGMASFSLFGLGAELILTGCRVNLASNATAEFLGLAAYSGNSLVQDTAVNATQAAPVPRAALVAGRLQGSSRFVSAALFADFRLAAVSALLCLNFSAGLDLRLVGSKAGGKAGPGASPLALGYIQGFAMSNSQYCVTGTATDEQGQNCKAPCFWGAVLGLSGQTCVA